MTIADATLTCDDFLGGRLRVWQPRKGYRAGVDPVFLAASVPARSGQSILELGCGVGVASLCLASRVPGLTLTGVERQPFYADLARRNAAENAVPLDVTEADLADLPATLRQRSFDHVIANPPYFLRSRGTPAPDAIREGALGEDTALAIWLDVALRRLMPGGMLTMVLQATRLPDVLALLQWRAGVSVLPLAPRIGRPARLILLRATKGGGAPFTLLAPVVLHQGHQHDGDRESYTGQVLDVLRNGAALPWNTA